MVIAYIYIELSVYQGFSKYSACINSVIHITTFQDTYYRPNFTDGKTEAHKRTAGLTEITQQVQGRIRIPTQEIQLQSLCS